MYLKSVLKKILFISGNSCILKEIQKSEMKLIFGRLFEYAKLKVNMENAIFFLILPKQQYPNSVTSTLLQ